MSYHVAQASAKPLPDSNAQIYFSTRHETHYAFTNVSSHPVHYKQQLYITAEHLFHAMKVSLTHLTSLHCHTYLNLEVLESSTGYRRARQELF